MRLGGVALDGDCREGGTFAIRLKLAFSEISNSTFKQMHFFTPLLSLTIQV